MGVLVFVVVDAVGEVAVFDFVITFASAFEGDLAFLLFLEELFNFVF